ncbi:MAG TPA: LamG-like jellyroll fold domain-containing protein, partial [Patescibacteria group bacterium]|nr:LamG-like jellyroll fold domain-containing protein [Patescibacteria group bacterium]
WVRPTVTPASTVMIVVGKDGASVNRQYLLALKIVGSQLIARPHVGVPQGYLYFDGASAIPLNTWTHLAMTYDGASLKLYVNGVLDGSMAVTGSILPTPEALRIGGLPSGPWFFTGSIDEPTVYSAALSGPEIQAIYAAGSAGKCVPQIPVMISSQPVDSTIVEDQTTVFSVGTRGTPPFSYQWSFGTNAIAGATNSSLVLTNVQMSQAGTYSVVVTNAYGSATSSNATLVVNFPAASVNVVGTSGTAGQVVTVPVILAANGNENAVGFSLNFSPTKLTNTGVTLGSGATGGSLQFNSGSSGTVGIVVALPSGTTFAPGTQEVAEVSFSTAISASAYSVPLTFGDQPTKSELSDTKANPLAVKFTGAQVTVSRSSFEADVAPRPNGDGTVSIVDWVQVGRYVAALDSPTNASEFQRADCAPRKNGGDGTLTVSDWVQAGRYAAGLDPLTLASGPSIPTGSPVGPLHKLGNSPTRTLAVEGSLLFQGQTATALVELDSQGDENAVGLSLAFDPKVVSYTGALLGSDATGATMDVNANNANNGQVGIILALPTGTSFSAGTRQLVKVSFQAITSASVDAAIALADQPVHLEVADTNATPVVATYTAGVIQVNPRPALGILQQSQVLNLTWPSWATNYNLQQADFPFVGWGWTNLSVTPVSTNNSLGVSLPVNGSAKFYRLQHQ